MRVQSRLSNSDFAHDHFEMDKNLDSGYVPELFEKDEKRLSVGSDSEYSFKINESYEEIALPKYNPPDRF